MSSKSRNIFFDFEELPRAKPPLSPFQESESGPAETLQDAGQDYYDRKSGRYDYGPLIGVLFVLVTGIASIVGFWQLVTRILP